MTDLLTADELAAEGLRRQRLGHTLVYLYPSQEEIAVKSQTPFVRYAPLRGEADQFGGPRVVKQ